MKDLEEINPEFARTDVVLVVGANDVTNPAARRPGNAVSGMPILDVDQAKSIIVIKRSLGHGYAGIDNELYTDPKAAMLFSDAKVGLTALLTGLKAYVHQLLRVTTPGSVPILIGGPCRPPPGAVTVITVAVIEFDERDLEARVPDLAAGGAWTRVRLRWRQDPLTGASARILTGVKLQPPNRPDLTELTAPPAFCPFDSDRLETATFSFPPELTAEGRIRCGRAVVVPNIMAYATHSAVGIYDPGSHFLDLDELTPALVGDALAAMVRHAHAVRRFDPTAAWSSVNANYLPPAGASLVHPHLQSAHDSHGLTGQRQLAERSAAWQERNGNYWAALIDQEAGGPRWVGQTGRVAWLTPFAPAGFHEVWAVVSGAADITDLTEDDSRALGLGLSRCLAAYKDWNLASFNFGLIGGGPLSRENGYQVVLKLVSRSNPEPFYRSDATYFERLWAEALIDMSPEEVAEGLRTRF